MQKPCDTCWLAREKTVSAVGRSLSALVHTFEKIYNDTGDDEAHGIATLLTKCTEACIYMYLHALTLCLSFKEDSKARILIWPVLLVWLRNTTERKFLNLTLTPKTQKMKLIQTRLRGRMGKDTLEHTLCICIEGPDWLSVTQLKQRILL